MDTFDSTNPSVQIETPKAPEPIRLLQAPTDRNIKAAGAKELPAPGQSTINPEITAKSKIIRPK